MSISRQEEIIAALWAICAVLAFGFDFTVWAWIFTVKAVSDTVIAIKFALVEIRKNKGKE